MSTLSKAKQLLIENAIQVYSDRRDDIPFEEYKDHFADMGMIIAQIESYNSLGDLINALEKGDLQVLGYFPEDEDMLEEFIGALFLEIKGE